MAVGLDIGTAFLVSATKDLKNESAAVEVKSIRDAFLDVEADQSIMNMLKMSSVSYVHEKDSVYIVGEPALSVANLLKRETRRPLSQGVISSGEHDAEKMLLILLKKILSDPKVENESVFFSVPAKSIDKNMDVIYHEAMFKKIIESFGYKATSMNEAAAIVYSNCSGDGFTALASSCLTPGQKIFSDRGFVNIEDFKKGMKVLTKSGLWREALPTNRDYEGDVYTFWAYGNGKVTVTEDHLIWCNKGDGIWEYIPAKDVKEGWCVSQIWDNYDFSDRPYLCTEDRITSSKDSKISTYRLTDEMAELIGLFAGDGSIEEINGEINWTLNKKENEVIDRIGMIVDSLFGKTVKVYPHGDNSVRVKMYSKGFLKWLKTNCYDENGVKKLPWSVNNLNDQIIRCLLSGLIATDGNVNKDKNHVGFDNTSPYLSQFVYLAMQRLCMCPSFFVGEPRVSGVVDGGRIIEGKKQAYSINVSGVEAKNFVDWLEHRTVSNKKAYNYGSNVARISSIEISKHIGKVYDVSVIEGDDHSFCLPGFSLHNCGAGMVNTALVFQTMVGMAFSVSRSGDWVDQSAAKAIGSTATRLMSIKEKGVNLLDPSEGDPKQLREREAIVVYYKNLIHYVIDSIKREFKKDNSNIELPEEIPWIISGGTSKAKNFLEFFKQEFEKERENFPISISDIRMANDPLGDVAKGLLIAAMND